MDNIFIRTDPAGNIKADKEKSTEKIDGAVAAIMGLDRAIRCGNVSVESVYDTRGLPHPVGLKCTNPAVDVCLRYCRNPLAILWLQSEYVTYREAIPENRRRRYCDEAYGEMEMHGKYTLGGFRRLVEEPHQSGIYPQVEAAAEKEGEAGMPRRFEQLV